MTMPFFSRALGSMVVDSVCVCGHLETDHGSKLKSIGSGQKMRLPHEGNCCAGSCACHQFTWARWAVQEEIAHVQEVPVNIVALDVYAG